MFVQNQSSCSNCGNQSSDCQCKTHNNQTPPTPEPLPEFPWDSAFSKPDKPKEKPTTNSRPDGTPEPIPDFQWDF